MYPQWAALLCGYGGQQQSCHAFGAIKASVQIARGQQRRLELLGAGMSIRERGWGITGHDLFPSYVRPGRDDQGHGQILGLTLM